ncbi:MAG: hypothetical protein EAZ62_08795 [Sphingobacteriia bacterium]|nr:MAG: hypothetical protein EAZ62_08795 [Sphingobacteriia bacterium]
MAQSEGTKPVVPPPKRSFKNLTNPDSIGYMNFKLVPVPLITSSPETGVRFGAAVEYFFNAKNKNLEARGSYLHGQMTFSTKNQFEISGGWQVFSKGEKFVFRGSGGFTSFNERFWGVGNQTLDNQDYYSQFYNRNFLDSRNYRLLGKQWYAGLAMNYSRTYQVRYSRPLTPDLQKIPGVEGSTVFGFGPAVLYEGRNFPFSATKGSYLELYYQRHAKVLGANYSYDEWMFDWRHFIPFGQTATWAFQFQFRETGGEVSLREMPRMGSSTLMRGFFTGSRQVLYSCPNGIPGPHLEMGVW